MNEENQSVNLDAIQDSLGGTNQNNIEQPVASSQGVPNNQALPKIEDIFSDTEAEKPAAFQPKDPNQPNMTGEIDAEEQVKNKRNLTKLVISMILLIAVFVGAYFGYNYYVKNGNKLPVDLSNINIPSLKDQETPETTSSLTTDETTEVKTEATEEQKAVVTPVDISQKNTTIQDTDGDGLSDQDEVTRGMDINNSDSDSDGLFDREEVMVYNTDPLNPDTDGDGFQDGAEVTGGYNPSGPGKLYDINQSQ